MPKPSNALAEAWWSNRRPGGLFDDPDRLTSGDRDAAFQVEAELNAFARDPDMLSLLFKLLAEVAESPDELAFIGTSVLEDAQRALGDIAHQALSSSGLDQSTIDVIRSGYWEPIS